MDKISAEKRSKNMSRIRSKNTEPEMIVRRLVFSMGYRYRLHYGKLPGKPDLVFPGKKLAIFVHGCFWHQHQNCIDGRMPKSKKDYWLPKLTKNIERDNLNQNKLKEFGWNFLVIWECEVSDTEILSKRLHDFLGG